MSRASACHLLAGLIGLTGLLLAGCSSQQLYATGQQWQRNECRKLVDQDERMRCEQSVATPFERYQTQAEGVKKR
jgi:hypothetical protein